MVEEIAEGELALALLHPPLADSEEAGQAPPGLPVGGIAEHAWRAVGEVEAAAGQHPLAYLAPLGPGADDAGPGCCGPSPPIAAIPSALAVVTSSPGCDPPRRKPKFVVTCSSA